MSETRLYKYLDANGGLEMLKRGNLQFTNAIKLNDPFDCHPALINFSNYPKDLESTNGHALALIQAMKCEGNRRKAWICTLSKVYDSMLMWAYYGNHQGVCIGLDMDKAKPYLDNIQCSVFRGAQELEVQYKDVIEKPDYFNERIDYYRYQYSTKAKEWEHEQEVRLLLIEPSTAFTPMALPYEPKEGEVTDWKEVRAYPEIGGECFDSLYLGIKIHEDKKAEIIKTALTLNPDIKIYQMEIDPKAFRLKENQI
jgi:hypothetical protein